MPASSLPQGQRLIDGFFTSYTKPKNPEPSLASSTGHPRGDTAPRSAHNVEALSLSSKRTWHSPDARQRRDALRASSEAAHVRQHPPQAKARYHSAAPQIGGAAGEPVKRAALDATSTTSGECTIRRGASETGVDQRVTDSADSAVMESSAHLENHEEDGDTGLEITPTMDEVDDGGTIDAVSPEQALAATAPPSLSPPTLHKTQTKAAPRPTSSGLQRVSSLTSAPASSLTTVPDTTISFSSTSTKRITRDGMEMVRNSDTESESEDSDPLEDLDIIVAREGAQRKGASLTEPVSVSAPATTARGRALRPTGTSKATTAQTRPAYRFTLDSLLKSKPESQEADEGDELRSLSDSGDELTTAGNTKALNEGALEAVMPVDEEDPGQAKRVLQAMQRADAFRLELAYYYLDPGTEADTNLPNFPTASLPHRGWLSLLRQPRQRQQVFSSGLAAKLCKQQPLPTEVLLWMLDSLCVGTGELLCLRYLEVLEQSKDRAIDLVTKGDFIDRWLRRWGAKEGQSTRPVTLTSKSTVEQPVPGGLRWFLELLQMLVGDLEQGELVRVTSMLTRLLVDARVTIQYSLVALIRATLVDLLSRVDENSLAQVQQSILQGWQAPALQEALIRALPASSPQAHDFRRRLAFAFTLGMQQAPDMAALSSLDAFAKLTEHVGRLARHGQQGTDYADLASNMAVLDVAVDAGFSTHDFAAGPEAEAAFNAAVGRLAAAARGLESSLVGGGLGNLHKTAAKAALDRLWCRLQYAVRTVPPPQRDYFGGGDGGGERQREVRFMSAWVKAGEAR